MSYPDEAIIKGLEAQESYLPASVRRILFLPHPYQWLIRLTSRFYPSGFYSLLRFMPSNLVALYGIWLIVSLGLATFSASAFIHRITSGTSWLSLGGSIVGVLAGVGLTIEGLIGFHLDLNKSFARWYEARMRAEQEFRARETNSSVL